VASFSAVNLLVKYGIATSKLSENAHFREKVSSVELAEGNFGSDGATPMNISWFCSECEPMVV